MGYRNSYSRSSYGTGSKPPEFKGTNLSGVKQRSFKSPPQINTNNYRTEIATVDDISKKYGFDYSRDYVDTQAHVRFQPRRDDLQSQRERLQYETESQRESLDHDYFKAFREQGQVMADRRMNAGIQAEGDLQLEFQRQREVADLLANQQLENQRIDREFASIEKEQAVYADQLYDDRLQQGFENAMDYSRFMQQENQFILDAAMRQRNQLSDEQWRVFRFNNMSAAEQAQFAQREQQIGLENAWREYEFNNMSEAQKQQLAADAERFGMEMAWERHKFDAGMAFEAGQGAGNFSNYQQTSSFGYRKDPITGQTRYHAGNDYAMPVGTPVASTVGGKVIRSGNSGTGWGNYVVVQDAQGNAHIYAHLSRASVPVGATVRPGQIVAASGNSGRSTGPHLHYEVRKGGLSGTPINPSQWA